jgi:hypothetical protein
MLMQRVLKISPGASHAVLLMCHLLATSGRQADAATVAAKAATASGMSTESLSLWASLMEHQALTAAAAAVGGVPSSAHEHACGLTAGADMNLNGDSNMGAEPEQAAAAADDDGGEDAGGSGDASDAAAVHNYVTACEEILAADPWALGAVEGEQATKCWKPNLFSCDSHERGYSGQAGGSCAMQRDIWGETVTRSLKTRVAFSTRIRADDPRRRFCAGCWCFIVLMVCRGVLWRAGLVQASGHCCRCTAAAVKGLLCHLDALLPETAAAALAAGAISGNARGASGAAVCLHLQQQLCHWWPVLSGLLLQLAVAAATACTPAASQQQVHGQVDTTPAAAAAPMAGGNAVAGFELRHQRDSPDEDDAIMSAPSTAAARPTTATDSVLGAAWEGQREWAVWEQLQQQCFHPRQQWWAVAGLCQSTEVDLLIKVIGHYQQQQQRRQQQSQLQQQGQANGAAGPSQQQHQQQQHHHHQQQQQQALSQQTDFGPGSTGVAGLLGSAADGGVSGGSLGVGGSGGVRFPPSQYQLATQQHSTQQHSRRSQSADVQDHGSQQWSEEEGQDPQQQQQQQQRGEGEGVEVEGLCELIMLVCSKAMELGFMCGPDNSYSVAAVVAFNAVSTHLSAAAAAIPGAAAGTQGVADAGCKSIALAATEAR